MICVFCVLPIKLTKPILCCAEAFGNNDDSFLLLIFLLLRVYNNCARRCTYIVYISNERAISVVYSPELLFSFSYSGCRSFYVDCGLFVSCKIMVPFRNKYQLIHFVYTVNTKRERERLTVNFYVFLSLSLRSPLLLSRYLCISVAPLNNFL